MVSNVSGPDRAECRNRLIAGDGSLPTVFATLPDAGRVADAISEVMFERHRGAYVSGVGEVVVFGNDGFTEDRRSRSEVAQVVEACLKLGLRLEAFGVCRDGYAWALVVGCPDGECDETFADDLHRAVWGAWCNASGVPRPCDRAWEFGSLGPSTPAGASLPWSRDGF